MQMSANLASEKIAIPKQYSKQERLAIAADVIEYIRDRSSKGLGPGRTKWPGQYSPSYAKSLDFENAGKSAGKINQSLSGDMLTEMEILPGTERATGNIVIGYAKGNLQHGKAEGNIIGSYGRKPNKSLARPFLTLTASELKKILVNYPLEDKDKRKDMVKSRQDAVSAIKGEVAFDAEM